jgi:hypothetical protein
MLPQFSGWKRDEDFNPDDGRQSVPLKFRLISIRLHCVTSQKRAVYDAVCNIVTTTDLDLMICLSFPIIFKVVNAVLLRRVSQCH